MDIIDKFQRLFSGLEDGYGVYLIKGQKKGDKVSGQAWTRIGPVTRELFENHLTGKEGLGICPINRSNVCQWGALDIDDYTIQIEEFERKVAEKKLPLVACRTKSGGIHLYLFIKGSPVSAIILRHKLLEFATILGYPQSEIFPKQTSLNKEDQGNWINLPYFDYEKTNRYAIKDKKALSIEEFFELAEKTAVTENELSHVVSAVPDDLSDAPPCLQYMAKSGVKKGQKDQALFNFAVYCKMKYGDDWEKQLEDINQKYFVPPALSTTMVKVIKPHKKKEYFYTCSQSPISQYCNKDNCKSKKYGIASGASPQLMIGTLTKINSSPPVWYLNIEGHRVEFSTAELLNQDHFRRRCFETIHKIPGRIKSEQWDIIMQDKLDNIEVIEAPEDAGPLGQFLYLLREFCTTFPATDKSELLRQKPWTEENETYFQSPALIAFLNKNKFYHFTTPQIYAAIKDLGGRPTSLTLKGKTIRVWIIPEFDKQTEGFDTPKVDEDPF